ncbi:TPA: VWA domain-containing protein [bacterium]|nr:VWA domain-containing protein [bacterium]
MGIINPLILIGILAAGIPFLIHLWSKKRAKIIDFSSIQFLMSINKRKFRRLRLRQILVLIMRMLIILFIVIGLARPVFNSRWAMATGGKTKRSIVIILDNSYSMGYSSLQGIRFDRAKDYANKIIDSLNSGDSVSLIFMSDTPKVVFKRLNSNINQVRDAINDSQISHRGTSVLSSILEAESLLKDSKDPQKQIYLITDLAENGWQEWRQISKDELSDDVEISIIKIGDDTIDNKAIESITISNEFTGVGIPVQITAKIKGNKGQTMAELIVDDQKKGKATVDGNTISFTHVFDQKGSRYGEIRLTSDNLVIDDVRYFALDVLGGIKVLVVGSNNPYINLALSPDESLLQTPSIQTDNCTIDELNSKSLDGYNIVLLVDSPRMTDIALRKLKAFNANGGNIIIFLGKSIIRDWYNSNFDLLPATLGNRTDFSQKPLKISRWDNTHSIFSVFHDEGTAGSLKSPEIYSAFSLIPKPDAKIIANFGGNIPAILESGSQKGNIGFGKVILFNLSPDPKVSDLPFKPAFLPLMQQTVFYLLANSYNNNRNLLVGEKYSQKVDGKIGSIPLITDPEKNNIKPMVIESSETGYSEINLDNLELSGIYKLEYNLNGKAQREYFAVNLDTTTESNLTTAKVEDVIAKLGSQIRFISPDDIINGSVQTDTQRADLSSRFLILALLLMLIEIPLANRYKIKEQEEL